LIKSRGSIKFKIQNMSAHSQPRFTAYLGETTNQFSDKQSIRSNQCGSELSGVAQNLH
jgi:hypothetical protein